MMILWLLISLQNVALIHSETTPAPSLIEEHDFAKMLKEFRFAAKNEKDDEAIALVDQLLVAMRDSEEKPDAKKAVRELTWAFGLKRKDDQDSLFAAVAASLGDFGKEGEKAILKSLKKKEIRERSLVVAMLLSSLGTFKNPENVEVLCRYLTHESADVVRGSSDSLKRYRLAEGEIRKEAVAGLIKGYENALELKTKAKREEDIEKADIYLNEVETAFLSALTELTGEIHEDPASWRTWYDAHKDESWKQAEPTKSGPSLLDRVGGKKKKGTPSI